MHMKLRTQHTRSFIFLLLLSISSIGVKGGGEGNEGNDASSDTSSTPIFRAFSDQNGISPARLSRLKDSLQRHFKNRKSSSSPLRYLNRQLPSKEQIVKMIDSLFDGGKVDRERMLGIKILIARYKAAQKAPFMIPYGSSPYPASSLLEGWNTRRIVPYKREIERQKRKLRLVAPEWGCGFQIPIDGPVTSSFGLRDGRQHVGVDLDLLTGDPVKAAFPGMVRISRYFNGYGRVVLIRHPNGLETLYAHLNRSQVEPGQEVEAGETIGTGGTTGRSTGSHLHFEVRYKGIPLNPAHFISFEDQKLMGDTLVLKKRRNRVAAYPAGTEFHKVKRGDYLYAIAQHYGTSVRKLCKLNGIERNSRLWVGQRIRVSR